MATAGSTRSRRAKELAECKAQVKGLKDEIAKKVAETDTDPSALSAAFQTKYGTTNNNNSGPVTTDNGVPDVATLLTNRLNNIRLDHCRLLQGHFGKVYDLAWGGDTNHLVSVSQDGMLIVWDPTITSKRQAVHSDSKWLMCCGMTSTNELICSGGLDNTCTIHKVDPDQGLSSSELAKLTGHDGYLSSCTFLAGSNSEILTTSGDSNAIIWDVERKCKKTVFSAHNSDVMNADVSADQPNMIATCSIDLLVKVWDSRLGDGKPVASIHGHESDVNSVRWFGDTQRLLSASDDASARIFDLRSTKQLQKFVGEGILDMASIERSQSGALVFSGHMDGSIYAWNTLTGKVVCSYGFEDRISRLRLAPNGSCFGASTWSMNVSILTT